MKLAKLHRNLKGSYQSSSHNVFRFAISSIHDKVDVVEVGKHPKIKGLLKGVFHERPPALLCFNMGFRILEGLGSFY